jgi:hypothetical protein
MMRKPMTAIGALAAMLLLALALPAASVAEEAIPPGNSAVNQYTESLPTGTGNTDTEKGGKQVHRSPGKTLGSRNAEKLEAHGPDGRAAAKAAAETAPSTSLPPVDDGEEDAVATPPANDKGDGGGGKGAASGDEKTGSQQPTRKQERADTRKAVLVNTQIDEPSGSSGLGEALGEATGASSAGQLGWLLPLLIVATAIWAFAYAMRQRRRVG